MSQKMLQVKRQEQENAMQAGIGKISVIIPWYEDNNLLKAIGSALMQKRQPDEVIIFNDGSTNMVNSDMWDKVKEIQMIEPKLRIINSYPNEGIGYARQAGLEQASGDWIAYLSSDDEWKPNFLSEMELAIKRNPDVDIFYCDYDRIDGNGNFLRTHQEYHFDDMEDFRVHLWKRCCVNISAAIFRATALKKVGFDENLRIGEDYLTLLMLARDYKFKHIARPLVKYRIHERQATNRYLNEIAENDRKLKEVARKYYEDSRRD